VAARCYGAAGGTLPNFKTVAILPFGNDAPEPALTQEVSDAVRQAFEGRLGLRVAPEATADALVRGRIVRYDPDLPVSVVAGTGPTGGTARRARPTGAGEVANQPQGTPVRKQAGVAAAGGHQPAQGHAGGHLGDGQLL